MRLELVFVLLLMSGVSVSAIDICIDLDAPSAPGNLSVSGDVGSILIEWSAAVDTPECSGIDYYNISRDGEWIGTTETLSFVDNASLRSGEYDYTVYAVDMAGGNAGASVKNSIVIDREYVSGGGGGGSSYVCESDWSCEEWTDCVGNERRRLCEDVNRCGTTYLKPEVYEECGEGFGDDSIRLERAVEDVNIEKVDIDRNEIDGITEFLSTVTGAVVGGGTGSVAAGGVLLLLSVLGFVAVKRRTA